MRNAHGKNDNNEENLFMKESTDAKEKKQKNGFLRKKLLANRVELTGRTCASDQEGKHEKVNFNNCVCGFINEQKL